MLRITMHRFAGVDKNSARIHSVVITVANVHDLSAASALVCGLIGHCQKARAGHEYNGISCREAAWQAASPTGHIRGKATRSDRAAAGFQKTRLRDLAKNRSKINVMTALTNLFLARRKLPAVG